jgi:hypothetical protein
LRVQLIRSALHWPIMRNAGASAIRAANVERDGVTMSWLLLSASIPPNPAPRSWVEREYCIDPASGLLQMWSEAPGIYAVYDYTGARNFHGHTVPQQISIFEDGRLAVQARLENLEDAPTLDPALFKRAPESADAAESFTLASPIRFPMRVDPSDGTSPFFQALIVHAILDAQDGTVLDAEALQTSDRDLSRAAIDLVRSTTFSPVRTPAGGFHQRAVSHARRKNGRPTHISHFRPVDDLGAPRQNPAREKVVPARKLALKDPRPCLSRPPPATELRVIPSNES